MPNPISPGTSWHDWLIPVGVTLVFALLAIGVAGRPSPWAGWAPATCIPAACFCEGIRDQLIRQPANSISSLLFLPPGLVILRRGWPDRVAATSYGVALVLIGLGSAGYHASLTFPGQIADVLGMYLLGTFAVLAAARRRFHLTPATVAVAYLAGNAGLLALLVEQPGFRRYAFAALIAAALLLEWGMPRPGGRRRLLAAVGCLSLGATVWALDLNRIVCASGSWLQGHAIWHGLTALAATLFYGYAVEPETSR